jgi:hypothetical protein
MRHGDSADQIGKSGLMIAEAARRGRWTGAQWFFFRFFEVVLRGYGVANLVISHGAWVTNAREAFSLILDIRTKPPMQILRANMA